MRRSKTIEKLKNNELVRFVRWGISALLRRSCHRCGFDAIWLDTEHRAWDVRELQAVYAYCHQCDIDCMLRPASIDKVTLYRHLEDGAAGMLVPHVNDVDRAVYLRDSLKFPHLVNEALMVLDKTTDFGFQTQTNLHLGPIKTHS